MESKIGLVLLIGLPGSGKTTLVNKISQFIEVTGKREAEYKLHRITYDNMIPVSIQSGSGQVSWKKARDQVLEQVKSMICHIKDEERNIVEIRKTCPSKTLIFIDDNMYYRSMRYEYFQLARMHGLSFCQLYLSVTVPKAVEWNNRRPSNLVPEEVIHRMATKLQPPDPMHNMWERTSLTILSEMLKIDQIYHFVTSSLENVVQPIAKSVQIVEPSVIHKADLELRKYIGYAMKEEHGDGAYMRSRAAALNTKRNDVLYRLRSGDVSLPEENVSMFLAQQLGLDDI